MKKIVTLLILVVIGTFVFSNSASAQKKVKKRIKEITTQNYSFNLSYRFHYDTNGRIIKIEYNRLNSIQKSSALELRYDSVGQLNEAFLDNSDTLRFTYLDKNKAVRTYIQKEGFEPPKVDTLIFNESGLLIKYGNKPTFAYDSKNNITNWNNIEYQYDTKNSFFSNQVTPRWVLLTDPFLELFKIVGTGKNNPLKTTQHFDDHMGLIQMVDYRYDYDKEGYPTMQYAGETPKLKFVYETLK